MPDSNLSQLEIRRRLEEWPRLLSEGWSIRRIASEEQLSYSGVRLFLKSHGIDTAAGERARKEEAALDRKHKRYKIRRYTDADLCRDGCGKRAKAKGRCRQHYLNWYKREQREARRA